MIFQKFVPFNLHRTVRYGGLPKTAIAFTFNYFPIEIIIRAICIFASFIFQLNICLRHITSNILLVLVENALLRGLEQGMTKL